MLNAIRRIMWTHGFECEVFKMNQRIHQMAHFSKYEVNVYTILAQIKFQRKNVYLLLNAWNKQSATLHKNRQC